MIGRRHAEISERSLLYASSSVSFQCRSLPFNERMPQFIIKEITA
jgi:hypothetical protein